MGGDPEEFESSCLQALQTCSEISMKAQNSKKVQSSFLACFGGGWLLQRWAVGKKGLECLCRTGRQSGQSEGYLHAFQLQPEPDKPTQRAEASAPYAPGSFLQRSFLALGAQALIFLIEVESRFRVRSSYIFGSGSSGRPNGPG